MNSELRAPSCMTVAADHVATVAARNTELKTIATAFNILRRPLGGLSTRP